MFVFYISDAFSYARLLFQQMNLILVKKFCLKLFLMMIISILGRVIRVKICLLTLPYNHRYRIPNINRYESYIV